MSASPRMLEQMAELMALKPTPEQIRDVRTRAGLTTAQAAIIVGVSRRTYCAYESGESTMHPILYLWLVEHAAPIISTELQLEEEAETLAIRRTCCHVGPTGGICMRCGEQM